MPAVSRASRHSVGVLIGLLMLAGVALPPRLWHLSSNPPSLGADELAMVVSWESIARTGRDLDGSLLPWTFNRVERHPPLYGLLVLPFTLAWGHHPLAVRLPAALLGVAGLLLLWPLGNRLLHHRWAGAAASGIMAVTPWHIHYSRIGWTPATAIPMLLIALYVWIAGIERRSTRVILLGAAVVGSTIYAYKAFDALAPVWLLVLLFLYRRHLTRRQVGAAILICALLFLPLVYTSLRDPLTHGRARAIFTFADGINARTLGVFARSYLAHYSPGFLFIAGDPIVRHHAPGSGQLYWWMAPLMALGLIALQRRRDLAHRGLLAAWLLIYPLGGSLTNDGVPHATRTLLGLPALSLLAALGLVVLSEWIWRQRRRLFLGTLVWGLLGSAVVIEGVRYAEAEFIRYPQVSGWWWDYGQAEVFETLWARKDQYDRVCLWTVSWDHEPTFRAYYLRDFPRPVTIDTEDPACHRPGALVASWAGPLPRGAVVERVVRDPSGAELFTVYGIPR